MSERPTSNFGCRIWGRIRRMFAAVPASTSGIHGVVGPGVDLSADARIGNGCYVEQTSVGPSVIIGENTTVSSSRLEGNAQIYANCILHETTMGAFSYVARDTIINRCTMGRFCSIGPRCTLGYGQHPLHFASTSPVFYSVRGQCGTTFAKSDGFAETARITIGHDVLIGAMVFVKDGVTIGNGAVVGAGAVVVENVPDYAIVGGVPAEVIRYRFAPDVIQRLQSLQWWNWSEERLRTSRELFVTSDLGPLLSSKDPS